MDYRDLITSAKHKEKWAASFSRELHQLAQGLDEIIGTNTIKFVAHNQVPAGIKAMYGRIVVNYRPQKDNPYHTGLTVGGDCINYP